MSNNERLAHVEINVATDVHECKMPEVVATAGSRAQDTCTTIVQVKDAQLAIHRTNYGYSGFYTVYRNNDDSLVQ